jgi:MFS family permease
MKLAPALNDRGFRSLWLAGLVSDGGDWMLLVALPIVVYRLTGSALGTSAAFLAELAPGVALAPLAGALADRLDRRRLMLAVTLAQTFCLLPLLAVHGRGGLAIVYAVIMVQAALATLFDPAKNALLPTLLPPGELVSGNSLIALNNGIGRLAGGPLGGLLLAAGQLHAVIIADAATFLIAAGLIASVRLGTAGPAPAPGEPIQTLTPAPRDGPVTTALVVTFVAQVAQGIFVVLFILFVARRLHGGSGEIGALRGVQAVGAIAAGAVLGLRGGRRFGRPGPGEAATMIAAGALAFGLISLLVWNLPHLTTSSGVYMLLFVIVGAPGVVMITGMISYLQMAVGDRRRGRVFGAFTLAGNAGQAVGIVAAGLLTAPLGLMAILESQGCIYLLAGLIAAFALVPRSGWAGEPSATLGR